MNKLIALLIVCNLSLADAPKCDSYVKACEETVAAQDQAIDNLKKSVKVLKEELNKERTSTPRWVLVVGGMAIGVILSSLVSK